MGGRIIHVNDIEILRDMIVPAAQIPLQPGAGKPSVELKDVESGTIVEIKGVPHDSIVVRAEYFRDPLFVFNGCKGERKRADFVIVSDKGTNKWIVCIETTAGDKPAEHVTNQLRGAQCFMSYCKCIGRSFWEEENFLEGYQYRFVCMKKINVRKKRTGVNPNKISRPSRPTHIQSRERRLHNLPNAFLIVARSPNLHFGKLISKHL